MKTCSTLMVSHLHDEAIFHADELIFEDACSRIMLSVLNFLAHRTRPDLASFVEILSRFKEKQMNFVTNMVKPVLNILKVQYNIADQ